MHMTLLINNIHFFCANSYVLISRREKKLGNIEYQWKPEAKKDYQPCRKHTANKYQPYYWLKNLYIPKDENFVFVTNYLS